MKVSRRIVVVLLSVVLVALFSWSFFQPTFFRTHDFTHVARLMEFKRALDTGQVPVHWSQNFGYGYGMPLFLFYGPLPSLMATALNTIGLSPVWAVKMVFALTGVIAFAGAFAFLRRWGNTGAIVGATLILAAPYRAVDLYVRGALNEAFAIGLLPWILHGIWLLPEKPRPGFVLTAFSSALLILTHNLTALMALPIFFLLGTLRIFWLGKKRARSFFLLCASGALATILSLFYALPSFLEKDQTIIGEILSGYFDFRLHFLYIRQLILPNWGYGGSEYGPADGISFHLGYPVIIAVGLTLLATVLRLIRQWRKKHRLQLRERDWVIVMFSLTSAGALFLTLTHAQPIWETIPLLPFIQFPWRFLSLAAVLLALVAGIGLSLVTKTHIRWFLGAALLAGIIVGQQRFHRPEAFLENDDGYYYTDEERIRTQMSDILPDYLPNTFDRSLPPVNPDNRIVLIPAAEYRWELNRPHELLLFTDAPGGSITWNIADFPGWEYFVNDVKIEPELLPDGRRQFSASEKIETVGARFTTTPLRSWTLVVSFLGWVVLAAIAIGTKRDRHETT